MPWEEKSIMDLRLEFVQRALTENIPFSELCKEYNISRKTGYKWKQRFLEYGYNGLANQSTRPESSPNQLSEDTVIRILQIKQAHPNWGARKIQKIFEKSYPLDDVPSESSIKRILDKAGLVKKTRVSRVNPSQDSLRQGIQPEKSNDVWTIDFKGWWKSAGEVCEPFTVRDLYSRMVLEARLMRSKSTDAVREVMTELFRKYGLPKVIRSDNGTPFAAPNGLLSLTRLSAWWITLGIIPDRTDKGKPGQNGSLERMHADIANEIQGCVNGGIHPNQIALDAWREEYNTLRPNEAIGMLTPADLYTPSERRYTGDYDDIEYPPGYLPRKVYPSGEISVSGLRVTIGFSLRGLRLGLRPRSEHGYDVFLADFLLGSIDIDSCCFTPLESLQ